MSRGKAYPCVVSIKKFTARGMILSTPKGEPLIPLKLCYIQHPTQPGVIALGRDTDGAFRAECLRQPKVLIWTKKWLIEQGGLDVVPLKLPTPDKKRSATS